MNSNSNYETLYGVGLLDDLHNYFPALLYDSSSFGSVRDVMAYVQRQTRARFDLFSYGQREYLNEQTHASAPSASVSAAAQPSYRRVIRTSYASMPATVGPVNSTLPTQLDGINDPGLASTITQMLNRPIGNAIPQIQVELNTYDADEEEDGDENSPEPSAYIANALLRLLNLPAPQRTGLFGRGPMDTFLQPVVVHPTADQINANTTEGRLVSDTEHACAICQDALTADQEGRKLNQCGHWFHKQCIDTWFERDVHCPVCRHDIRESVRQQTREDLEADLH
jgi:hypothetical protein